MTFKEALLSTGYEIESNKSGKIKIQKSVTEAILYIYFDKETKTICGIMQPQQPIITQKHMNNLAKHFETLQNDLLIFQEMSDYEIIY